MEAVQGKGGSADARGWGECLRGGGGAGTADTCGGALVGVCAQKVAGAKGRKAGLHHRHARAGPVSAALCAVLCMCVCVCMFCVEGGGGVGAQGKRPDEMLGSGCTPCFECAPAQAHMTETPSLLHLVHKRRAKNTYSRQSRNVSA